MKSSRLVLFLTISAVCLSFSLGNLLGADPAAANGRGMPASGPSSSAEQGAGKEPENSKGSVIEHPEGEWRAFILQHGRRTARAPFVWILTSDGQWGTRQDGKAEAVHSGIFRLSGNRLLFFPPQEQLGGSSAQALIATAKDKDSFLLGEEAQTLHVMEFRRLSLLRDPDPEFLSGTWRFTQLDPETKERRKSPFRVLFSRDGRYSAEADQGTSPLPPGAAEGSWILEDGLLRLRNQFKGEGFWKTPVFFRDGDTLVLNRSGIHLYGEKETP